MKQNYWKSLAITFLVSIAFALIGCQKGAIDGQSEETSTTEANENHVAQESLVDNDGKIQVVDQLTATLGGIVVDELGMPVADATVSVLGNSVETNIGGSWQLADVPVTQVITQAALAGISNIDGNLANDAQPVTTIAVSVVKDGYSSAVVSVATTAIVTESNASLDGDTAAGSDAGNDTSDAQPNTLVLTGLVGTSANVVLKNNNSSVTGYLRNHENGNPVAGVALTLVPDRTAAGTTGTINDAVIGNLGGAVGTVTYGYKNLTTTTSEDGSFTFTMVTAATDYELVINSANYLADIDPANDVAGELPGDAGAGNEDLDVGGDDAQGNNGGNGAPGQNPAAAGNVNAELALNGAANGWMLNVTNQVTNSLGNLWVSKIESTDNVNPYITWIDNAFELTFNDANDDFVQLDDTVDMVTTPVEIYFSEVMNATRVNGQFDGQAPEYTETAGGKAVPILVYQRDIDADGQAGIACAATPTVAPNALCKDIRHLVDDTKTTLEGNKLTLYLKTAPVADLHYVDVLIKQTDFMDMYGNHLVDVSGNRAAIVPDLAAAMAKVDGAVADDRQDGIVDPLSYRNYWQVRFKLYPEGKFSYPEPKKEIPRPLVSQITCSDADNVGGIVNPAVLKTQEDANGVAVAVQAVKADPNVVDANGNNINFIVYPKTQLMAGLCDIDAEATTLGQYNADALPMQEGMTDKSRLTVLAQAYAAADATTYGAWDGVTVDNNVAAIRLTGDVTAGVTYKVTSTTTPALQGDQYAIVLDANGSDSDAEAAKYYQGMVNTDDATAGFTFVSSGANQELWFKGLTEGTVLTIVPTADVDGSTDFIVTAATNTRTIGIDDLTPPMVAVQSENLKTELEALGGATGGSGDIDDVPGEVLIEVSAAQPAAFYPGLKLTASLYDRGSRRAAETTTAENLAVPLLAIGEANGLASGKYYTKANFDAWETLGQQGTNNSHFSDTVRDVIIEMTEPMEGTLEFCDNIDVTAANANDAARCQAMEPAFDDVRVDGARAGGQVVLDAVETANVTDFKALNITDATLTAQLQALRSYSAENAEAYLVATLLDWRRIADQSLMGIMGLRDDNKTEVINKDAGVVFLDYTPPMAKEFNVTAAEAIEVKFDQPIKALNGKTVTVMGEGDVVYTFTFSADVVHGTVGDPGAVVTGVAYTDYLGKAVTATTEIPVIVTVTNTAVDGTLTLALKLEADGENYKVSTSPDVFVNMKAYFAPVSSPGDTDVSVKTSGISDTTRDDNNWEAVTATANNGNAALSNDAYVCDATTCYEPELLLTADAAATNAADAPATLAYLGANANQKCLGLGITSTQDSADNTNVDADYACARVNVGNAGDAVSNSVFLDMLHSNGKHINSYLPASVNVAGDTTIDNMWSAGDGAEKTGNTGSASGDAVAINWAAPLITTTDADESYTIVLNFREEINCGESVTDAGDQCNMTITNNGVDVAVDDNSVYEKVGTTSISANGKAVTINFTRNETKIALGKCPIDSATSACYAAGTNNENNNTNANGDMITLLNVKDFQGNAFTKITIELLDTDRGVEVRAYKDVNGAETEVSLAK